MLEVNLAGGELDVSGIYFSEVDDVRDQLVEFGGVAVDAVEAIYRE